VSDIPKDIIESFKSQINERLASPLTGSFTIAWLIWNYKFIVILFSANSVTKTFDLIHKICFPDFNAILLNGFLYPLFSTLIYVFIIPYPASWVYSFTRIRQKVLAEIRQKVDDETPLPMGEAIALRNELRKKDADFDQALSKSKIEIEELQRQLVSLDAEVKMYRSVNSNKFSPTSAHIDLLSLISEHDFQLSREGLVDGLKITAIAVDYMLTELQENNYIVTRVNEGHMLYGLAQEGRRCLLNRSHVFEKNES